MRRTLDPKLDVVFKILFAHPANSPLLISLLDAVLEPSCPIAGVTVLNPGIPSEMASDKAIVLDVHVELQDGRHIDIEMQAAPHPAFAERALYYWARMYASGLHPGEQYRELEPCVSILILDWNGLRGQRFHSTFEVREVHDHELFSDGLRIDVLELRKLGRSEGDPPRLVRWGRFLAASTDDELDVLARSDPIMKQAQQALERLSADPSTRALAEERERGLVGYRLDLAAARKEGEAKGLRKGKAKGRKEGEAKGLREAIATACDLLGIELTQERRELLGTLQADALARIVSHLRVARSWPES